MKPKQKRLFDLPPKERAKPRKLMKVYDAGPCDETSDMMRFECPRCKYLTEWEAVSKEDYRKGIACPVCSGVIVKPEPKPELKFDPEVLKDICR